MTFMTGRSQNTSRGKARLLAMTALAAFAAPLLVTGTAAQAQTADATYEFDIPAQSLSRSINQVASRANIQVLYSGDDSRDATAPALKGRMTVDQALARLLAGTGYTYRYSQPGVITLVKAPEGNAESGELVTGVVSVEGYQGSPYFGGAGVAAGVNGINGSRDISATEGTGSFTTGAATIGSKVPQALKDVPQSISVLTSERLEQQNVTDLTSAMKQLPGITLVQGDSTLETKFYSRGFEVQSIQIDGGAPLTMGYGYYPQIDMAVYDHVELLRGAAGQFGAYGNPGGTINLVRKKPLDHAQYALEAQVGSWSNYRIVADASSPLGLDGKLRGRLVMTYQDNHHFYNVAEDNKTLVYGVAEMDVTPATILSAGVNYTRQNSVPWQQGLPRYLNGDDLELPRSTCLCFPWNKWNFDTTEIFGGLEQKIGQDWTFKLNLTRAHQQSSRKIGFSKGAVNPTNGLGPSVQGFMADFESKQLSAEATLSGAFTIFGQRQEITIGANRSTTDGGDIVSYDLLFQGTAEAPYRPYPGGPEFYYGSPNGSLPPINIFDFDPRDLLYSEPPNSLPVTRYNENGQTQTGAFVNVRLTAFDRLHLTTGLRWGRYENDLDYDNLCYFTTYSCAGKEIGDVYGGYTGHFGSEEISWPPPVTVSFDITKDLTAHLGYTDIYLDQSYLLYADLSPLPPVTGANWEAGIKWAANGGRLNFALSAYRIRQKGTGTIFPADYSEYYEVSPGVSCCYVINPDQVLESSGIDLDVTGELKAGWQISASYTYNDNQYKGSYYGTAQGRTFLSIQPKHIYRIWTSYDFGAAGHSGFLSGLTLSGGINGQSSGYRAGYTCVNFAGEPDPITGAQDCESYEEPDYMPYSFIVPSYALLSARIDYRFSDTWSLAVNLENILDKTYYQTVADEVEKGHWYGTPRSFTATLRAKW